ncbi:DNA repair protein complementing XP-C cells homolog [Battus philenor]|uniref:DNA repair protein complementing XP-C cells homolog n=1 Tax=Battus philenor TaxID=42288 RepID=UPI0035D0A09D
MPTTRKKVIKTVYKDEDDSEDLGGDFSDSGSEAEISPASSSDEDAQEEACPSSGDEFYEKSKNKSKTIRKKKPQFAKAFINKINKQNSIEDEDDNLPASNFSVKDLTEADKLLPSILNLSESDSSDDDSSQPKVDKLPKAEILPKAIQPEVDDDNTSTEYKDVWLANEKISSEEIAKKTFLELEQHKIKIEEAKNSILKYSSSKQDEHESDVKDLLAQGEEIEKIPKQTKKNKKKNLRDQSDSEQDDWEEVNETKSIPQQGLQLIVDIPDCVTRKTKKVDIEMMMKRRMNRVKKEYQVYMHKVHVLCWLGHGNYISTIINDQEVMSTALSLMPSKECYPGERVDMKYLYEITLWFNNKLSLEQDKHEGKFRPKAPKLKEMLLQQIKNRTVSSKKYIVYIFVALLRAIGLQCRIMLNFVTVPIRPPACELHSLSTKNIQEKKNTNETIKKDEKITKPVSKKIKTDIPQLDGNVDCSSDSDFEDIVQLDGNDDGMTVRKRSTRSATVKENKKNIKKPEELSDEGVSPPKRAKKASKADCDKNVTNQIKTKKSTSASQQNKHSISELQVHSDVTNSNKSNVTKNKASSRSKKGTTNSHKNINVDKPGITLNDVTINPPKIVVTPSEKETITASEFFAEKEIPISQKRILRKRALTSNSRGSNDTVKKEMSEKISKTRARSTPVRNANTSKYFDDVDTNSHSVKPRKMANKANELKKSEEKRVSHRDLLKQKNRPKNDVTKDLIHLVKSRIKEAKTESKTKLVKGKEQDSDEDSDYLPVVEKKTRESCSDDDFKPVKSSSKPTTSRRIDRRVLSQDDDATAKRIDVWCEVYVEELEEWVAVDIIRNKMHCVNEIYARATHPVTYIVGWDNNNYLKDLTRRYVPQWNTVTRKQRVENAWWNTAVQPWLGPKNARDREEDERLDRMQLEAPLPKTISEYKNHPLYALKRHLLKYEAIYPPDASTLGFVRGEPVYARECVYVCKSRDTWLKDAKVVKLGEKPYKIVKARPKWDRLSNKLITDKPLEIFGPWQIQDYEPPVAENGIVPRNAYGNVELFKDCMLPKGTVHIKLPGLNRVAKKLNIDCAPAMTGFDFNGGWTHPVFEGFVVCKEFEEILKDAWVKDQEEQERKEREKIDTRVYGNWKKLIKGLLIRERLKLKYGFDDPSTSQDKKKPKGPRLVVKKTK